MKTYNHGFKCDCGCSLKISDQAYIQTYKHHIEKQGGEGVFLEHIDILHKDCKNIKFYFNVRVYKEIAVCVK